MFHEVLSIEQKVGMQLTDLVIMHDHQAVTTSLQVAGDFGREHKHVLESIEKLTAEKSTVKKFFADGEYTNSRGRKYPMVYMNR